MTYRIKAFYTNGASTAEHEDFPLAWSAYSHTIMRGCSEGNLVRAEFWLLEGETPRHTARAVICPLAIFDLALVEERHSTAFREIELTRGKVDAASIQDHRE